MARRDIAGRTLRVLALLVPIVSVLSVGRAAQLDEPAGPYSPLVESQAELDAFRSIHVESRPGRRLARVDAFLAAFPESELRYLVVGARWRALVDTRADPGEIIRVATEGVEAARAFLEPRLGAGAPDGDHALAGFELANLEAGYYRSMAGAAGRMGDLTRTASYTEQAVAAEDAAWLAYERLAPGTSGHLGQWNVYRTRQLGLFQNAMVVFSIAGAPDRALEYGERALGVDPNDLLTLITLSSLIAENPSDQEAQRGARLEAGLDYASRAIGQLGGSTDAPSATGVDPDDRVRLEASVRSSMGLMHYQRAEYEAAVDALLRALQAIPDDARTHYRLGLAYAGGEEPEAALRALARAVYLGIQDPGVRARLEGIYQAVHGSLDGMEGFIESEGVRGGAIP